MTRNLWYLTLSNEALNLLEDILMDYVPRDQEEHEALVDLHRGADGAQVALTMTEPTR